MKQRFWMHRAGAAALLVTCSTVHAQVTASPDRFGDAMRVMLPAAAAALTFAKNDSDGFREWAYTTVLAAGATEGLKYAVNSKGPDGSARAFPSGHTSMAFSAASFVHERYGLQTALPLYVLAGLTAYSRVHTHHHYARDVVGGALVGTLSAQLVTHRFSPAASVSLGYSQHTLLATYERSW